MIVENMSLEGNSPGNQRESCSTLEASVQKVLQYHIKQLKIGMEKMFL